MTKIRVQYWDKIVSGVELLNAPASGAVWLKTSGNDTYYVYYL